jgi:putative NADH-flavin reductase
MNIVVIGATGNIGRAVVEEALRRGHTVTATTRDPAKVAPRPGVTVKAANTADVAATAEVLRGHDAAILSVKWNEAEIGQVVDALARSGVKRCLFVVGAGSLIRKDGRTHFEHMAEKGIVPPTSKPAALALEALQKVAGLEWTAISPAASIQPGARTGKFRLGLDHLIEDDKGQSLISREDFAIAILDELETPRHVHRRFTAAY